ncbi:hypothetical protein SAMN05216464_106190 [Mucilaginibacter pineti]|uniref:Uncharacterized protein n=1 Tax=Mucilaginibacter pineti TaxID=1391627 RepID=A0A1G7D2F4_9SPHI|nr:hypothetical protein [Mucilaginibacter pineti]SDE45210.1 hypothetical protein SAMN05216464_106190 [Mucilaginibacter pineti]
MKFKVQNIQRLLSFLFFLTVTSNCFSQCIDISKIEFGGDYDFYEYIFGCPTYSFAVHGDTSKNWNVLNNAIDIKQAPKKALTYRNLVEKKIKQYSGLSFFTDLKFIDVEVVYPEKYNLFKGRTDVTQRYCKAKYFYHYQFQPDTVASYLIGIAVNEKGKIISPFKFPSKKDYKQIDKSFTYCKLLDIARNIQKDIDPIGKICFEYNEVGKRFYWLISQDLDSEKTHEGLNYFNQVIIDASDFSKVKTVKGEAHIIY